MERRTSPSHSSLLFPSRSSAHAGLIRIVLGAAVGLSSLSTPSLARPVEFTQPQPASPAAEAMDKLKQENDALKRRVVQLEQQLREARAEIDAMKGGVPVATPDAPATKTQADIPADPLASPASMLAALKASYAAELAEFADGTNQSKHRPAVAKWVDQQKKAVSGKTQWLVRFVRTDADTSPKRNVTPKLETVIQIIDPASKLPIGEAFRLEVPARFLKLVQSAKSDEEFTISGTFSAAPKFNPQRETPGTFDVPPMIGKYAEYDYTLVWDKVEAEKPAKP
jgi:hypothetical protein